MNVPIAILAGGLATRMRPLTGNVPKSLLKVAGKPFVDHQLRLLKRKGFSRVVLCVGHLDEQIRAVVGNGSLWGLEVAFVHDGDRLLGTGGALRKALPLLDDRFFVLYGDSYLDCDYGDIAETFQRSSKDGLMTVHRNAGLWDRSNVHFKDGHIVRYDKSHPTPEMEHIDYGLGMFCSSALEAYPLDVPLDLAGIYQDLLAQDRLAAYEVHQRFYEIGSISGLEELDSLLRSTSL